MYRNLFLVNLNCLFLGVLASSEGVSTLPEKVKAVAEFHLPKTIYELRRFLSMINFHRQFLERAAHIQTPFHNLVKSNNKREKTPIDWTPDALENCQTVVANATLLANPKNDAIYGQFLVRLVLDK
ncbi:hypothetical protein AVEN_165670-1 [Araneus ventricosus]|uniref:Reverse transcriptase/retrotransposon-derived protein RNase H-like domain-containing protein n=1 Tax=Araneus ventricosus TaxID=182803 RepID=A0A4Y2LJY7_ARAVE|nr:hypothetical protein AVEN_165670-1 [Araneus ventricosus]